MGWITRLEGKDKREKRISLTDKVDDEFQKWLEAAENIETNALHQMDQNELNVFNRVLNQMMKNLGEIK